MKISFGNKTMELNIFDISKQPLETTKIGSACLMEGIIEAIIEDPWRHALLNWEKFGFGQTT
jgi:hypothetical protein